MLFSVRIAPAFSVLNFSSISRYRFVIISFCNTAVVILFSYYIIYLPGNYHDYYHIIMMRDSCNARDFLSGILYCLSKFFPGGFHCNSSNSLLRKWLNVMRSEFWYVQTFSEFYGLTLLSRFTYEQLHFCLHVGRISSKIRHFKDFTLHMPCTSRFQTMTVMNISFFRQLVHPRCNMIYIQNRLY